MRKCFFAALAGIALLIATGAAYELKDRHRRAQFHGERFTEITRGMTEAEVEATLGAPPGNYARGGSYGVLAYGVIFSESARREVWIDDAHVYEVHYTRENTVTGTHVRDNLVNAPGYR